MMVEYLRQQGRRTYFGESLVHWLGNFVKSYVVRRGFLDGSAGLFLAWHIANASFMKYHLLSKHRTKTDDPGPAAADPGPRTGAAA
jgi:hypothetical protein